ncbi:MAG TPA: hypothetical protein VNX28_08790 [Gemmataceae bacterium]|jgi:hypothetical protein|nr:hypothetical protein [Gemmataceae bacterium]
MQATEMSIAEGAIWSRMLEPDKLTLSPASAKDILALDFPEADKVRMHELAAKAREGTLTSQDEMEIDIYGRVGSVLSIWKSKARKSLRKPANGRG